MDTENKMAATVENNSADFKPHLMTKIKICVVCKQENCTYKCPICEISYCSLKCYKIHKETPCVKLKQSATIPIVPEATENNNSNSFTQDEDFTVLPEEILRNLGQNKEILDSLCNSDLRKILLWINNSKDPHKAIHTAMMEPIFVDFVNECLNVVENDT